MQFVYFLYHYGGIYADLDFESIRPLDPLLKKYSNYDVILGRMGKDKKFEHSIPNALMISKPRADFWLYVINEMSKRVNKGRPEYDTGPVLLKHCVDTYKGTSKIKILSTKYFYPIDWNTKKGQKDRQTLDKKSVLSSDEIKRKYPDSYAITFWSHTWE